MPEFGYKQNILSLLEDLAVLDPQLGPVELCCMWFDDLYLPELREWTSCFSSHELKLMATFHDLFASRVDGLPTTGEWQQDPGWQAVSNASQTVLDRWALSGDDGGDADPPP